MEGKKLVKCVIMPLGGTSTAADTEAVAHEVIDEDWKITSGSIWHDGKDRPPTRVRSRATTCQLVQLVKFMEKHKELAVACQPVPETERLWDRLTAIINQFGPPKTTRQCKTTWRDLRKRAFAMMRSRNKDSANSRKLYGMAPRIVSLIAAAGGLRKTSPNPPPERSPEQGSQSSSSTQSQAKATTEVPLLDPLTDQPAPKAESSSGNQLVIRVSDKLDSKTNVFNRFSVSDGYFENNIIVKEEQEYMQQENEEPEQMEAENPKEFSRAEVFPAVQAVLGNQETKGEGTSQALKEINETFRKFVAEYSDRTAAMRERTALDRERIALDRARLKFEMDMLKKRNDSAQDSDES